MLFPAGGEQADQQTGDIDPLRTALILIVRKVICNPNASRSHLPTGKDRFPKGNKKAAPRWKRLSLKNQTIIY